MQIRIRMNIPNLLFENLVSVFRVKKFNSFMQIRIRDLVNPGSGMEKVGSGIRAKHSGSATLTVPQYLGTGTAPDGKVSGGEEDKDELPT